MKKWFNVGLLAALLSSCSTQDVNTEKSVELKKAELYYSQGTNELVQKKYQDALINLLKASEYDPKDSHIRNNLGMAYYFREKPDLAIKELEKSIELDPKNSDARVNLGSIYLEKNLLKEAKAQYEIVTQDLTYTNQFRNYYNLALLELRIGDRKEAYEYLEKSIKEKEDYCQAHFKLGELYMEEYKFTQALSSFQESSKGTCVTEPAPHYQQALALINLNRFEEARIKLKMLMEKHGKTRFYSLSQIQLKKISDEIREQATLKTFQTETVKESQSVESPNF
jgi:Tfp pilus assembly protein PilF